MPIIIYFTAINGTFQDFQHFWLKQFPELYNGIPSHDIFARVFARLDPEKLETQFRNWVQTIAGKLSAQVIAIDEKTSRGSYDRQGLSI
jgi:hypothetical protein